MAKTVLALVILWLCAWVFAFGHAANNPQCLDQYEKMSPGCFFGGAMPFGWPFYLSWMLQSRDVGHE